MGSAGAVSLLALAIAAGALVSGWRLDAELSPTQPMLFWRFLGFGLAGAALGWYLKALRDRSALRRLAAAVAALLAWRLGYFPLMVICGWLASVGEWVTFTAFDRSVIYPTFLLLIFAINFSVAWIAAAALTVDATPLPLARASRLASLLRRPPRVALFGIGILALPVAALVTFSKPSDVVWFADRPWSAPREIPPIHDPERNPYLMILREHDLDLPARVLAFNALVTYPLVPEGPWGSAMKGTLEALALENPLATSLQRIDEHYLAYLAAHPRLHASGRS